MLPAAAGLSGTRTCIPTQFSAGFHTASFISAGLCVSGGVLAAVTIRNPRQAAAAAPAEQLLHCGLDGPPSRPGARGPPRPPFLSRFWPYAAHCPAHQRHTEDLPVELKDPAPRRPGRRRRRRHGAARGRADRGPAIAAIGLVDKLPGECAVIELAPGSVICPGFIDAHAHTEGPLLASGRVDGALAQGVTTLVVGQDGESWIGATAATARYLNQYFGPVNGALEPARDFSVARSPARWRAG